MVRTALSSAVAVVLAAMLAGATGSAQGTSTPPAPASPHAAVLQTYCLTCHNDRTRTADLSLEHADLTDVAKSAATWEKVIRKVRAGMMPPAGMPRPDAATLDGFVSSLETSIDRAAATDPRPGRTAIHRLNRAEYANAIRDLLALDIDSAA